MRSTARFVIKQVKNILFGLMMISVLLVSLLIGLVSPDYMGLTGQERLIARLVGIVIVAIGVIITLVMYELRDSR